ncbi:STAS domain-containing protein [Kitasatospora sp. NPDC059571]|uniref:STAS domain-containing protein n=1 Tax=Kitasatospora sp. NPDC059571 TaxID=3346871 RepID=UPI00367CF7FA
MSTDEDPFAAVAPPAPALRITPRETPIPSLIIRLEGEVTQDERAVLEQALEEAVAAGPALLVVDLTPLVFCSSACLNALLRARLAAEEAGVWLVLAGPGPQLRQLLDITGTDRVFTVRPSLQAVIGPHHNRTG